VRPTRPLVRYHGGKWMLAPWIIANMPKHRVYVEPFGGGASVLLRKARSYAEVYNDLDGEIVNLFRVVRDNGHELTRRISLTPFSRVEFVEARVPSDDPVEQARRTLVKSYQGFGSASIQNLTGFRSSSNRSGTTPAHDWANFPHALVPIIDRLRGVVIEHKDAADVMLHQDSPETLHFVDPPYVAATRDSGSDYRHEMSDSDHRVLASTLRSLRGMVVVCGYPSALYDEIFDGWHVVMRDALADGAKDRTECLWISPNAITQYSLMTDERGAA
jgi:DNA adenine methylase